MKPQQGKVSSAVLFVVVVVVIGGLLGGLGYWYGKEHSSKNTQNSAQIPKQNLDSTAKKADTTNAETATASSQCSSSTDPSTFYSKLIGLEFCYPKEWGEAVIGTVPASASNAGSAYEVTFTENQKVTVASATSDYVNTIGRGGRCADPASTQPDFSGFSTSWKIDGALGDIQSASRDTSKKDGVYNSR